MSNNKNSKKIFMTDEPVFDVNHINTSSTSGISLPPSAPHTWTSTNTSSAQAIHVDKKSVLVDTDASTKEMLVKLKLNMQEILVDAKDQLQDIADQYEEVETTVNSLTKNINDIDVCLRALEKLDK